LLLKQLALKGCLVTIDAMGTQTKIAEQIIDQEGEYALARHATITGTCMTR
jgi:predicted transposase YbfD/YdcC